MVLYLSKDRNNFQDYRDYTFLWEVYNIIIQYILRIHGSMLAELYIMYNRLRRIYYTILSGNEYYNIVNCNIIIILCTRWRENLVMYTQENL